jgi:hypothetical protein
MRLAYITLSICSPTFRFLRRNVNSQRISFCLCDDQPREHFLGRRFSSCVLPVALIPFGRSWSWSNLLGSSADAMETSSLHGKSVHQKRTMLHGEDMPRYDARETVPS